MTPILTREKEDFLSAIEEIALARRRDPAWLVKLRSEAAETFAELEFPTTRDEEWKYTNITPLLKTRFRHFPDHDLSGITFAGVEHLTISDAARSRMVFINGLFEPALSNLSGIPEGVTVANVEAFGDDRLIAVHNHLGRAAQPHDSIFTALNTAALVDCAIVNVPAGKVIDTPVHLHFVTTDCDTNTAVFPRVLLRVERGGMATVIESYSGLGKGSGLTTAVTEVFVEDGGYLDHYRVQEEPEHHFHIATTEARVGREGTYRSCAISVGARLARHDLNVVLDGEYAECIVDGLYVAASDQHIDNHTTIDHQKAHAVSSQLYKGIIDGDGRAVFNGKIFVREGALLTDARQLNKNLLLSDRAKVDTKPQLEIYADDVKCAHGATVGQLEDEELFYLETRGISPERARSLLTFGFAEDVIRRIRIASLREQLDRIVLGKLHESLEVT
jgi:Fe-S cluster assembly protein SufD